MMKPIRIILNFIKDIKGMVKILLSPPLYLYRYHLVKRGKCLLCGKKLNPFALENPPDCEKSLLLEELILYQRKRPKKLILMIVDKLTRDSMGELLYSEGFTFIEGFDYHDLYLFQPEIFWDINDEEAKWILEWLSG